MNKLKGKIIDTITIDQFTKVKLEVANQIFISIVIAISEINPSLAIGKFVNILFKETDVTLSVKMPELISIANKIPGIIKKKESGVLLSRLIVNFGDVFINAVVPSDFATHLKVEDEVVLLIRSNEIMLMD